MPPLSPFEQIAERVELLLAHHAELERHNALLAGQVAALSMERDSLRSRLNAARARVDALVERLPAAAPAPTPVPPDETSEGGSEAAPSSSPLPPKDGP